MIRNCPVNFSLFSGTIHTHSRTVPRIPYPAYHRINMCTHPYRIASSPDSSKPLPACTVYLDGVCPVCRREISVYQGMRSSETITWLDVARCDEAALGPGLDRRAALQRLHVRCADGTLVSGVAAFVKIWKRMPAFAWLARVCSGRQALAMLEVLYSGFLRLRRYWRPPAASTCRTLPDKF